MQTAQIVQHPNTEFLLMLEFNRLKLQLSEIEQKLQCLKQSGAQKQILVFTSNHHKLVKIEDIIMIRASSNYSTIYLSNGEKLFTSKTLKHWESTCGSAEMVRIHKSYLVNRSKITSIDAKNNEVVLYHNMKAKYSRISKDRLLDRF